MKKKFLVGALALVMGASTAIAFSACKDDNPPASSADITEGVYDGSYSGGGYAQETYFRFFDEGELFSGQQNFYYHARSYTSSASTFAVNPLLGTYEIKDEPIKLSVYPNHDDKSDTGIDATEMTADKTVVLKDLNGTTLFTTGWDTSNNKLLGIPVDSSFSSSMYREYVYANSDKTYEDYGVAIKTLYCTTDAKKNASITLYHNGTYEDDCVTGAAAVDGTYTVSGSTYTLTAGTGATGGTLVTGETITFTPTGGSAITMSTERDRESVYVFTGTVTTEGYTTTTTLTLYDDLSVDVSNNGTVTMTGTWEEKDGEPYSVIIKGVGKNYVESASDDDGNYYFINMTGGATVRTESVEEQVQELYKLTGTATGKDQTGEDTTVNYALSLKSDFTFALNYNGTMDVATGTWEVLTAGADAGKYQLTVKETFNNMFTVDSTWLVAVTYDSDYTAVTGLSVEIPAVSAMFISGATLTWSSRSVMFSFTGSMYSGAVNGELKIYSDNTCEYWLNGNMAVSGTYTTNGTGGTVDTVTLEGYEVANVTPDWTNMQLKVTLPDVGGGGFTLEVVYDLPAA